MPSAVVSVAGRGTRGIVVALLMVVLAPLLLVLGAGPAAAADAVPAPDGPYIGPVLDWTDDSAREYADRLGTTPSLFAQSVRYPLTQDDRTYLRQFVEQAAQQGSLAFLTLEPTVALDELTTADAEALGRQLVTLHRRNDTTFIVRFAPEMNGSWTPWGQQPAAYRAAFRTVAEAVHRATPHASMLWSPAYGAGYPFGRAFGAVDGSGPRVVGQLDTDDDGTVDASDEPYSPYWPGEEAVDWVGLSIYHYGRAQSFGKNIVPSAGEFSERLDETYGYDTRADQPDPFYETYADGHDKPMAIETGALYNPNDPTGAEELAIKQGWWRQVFSTDTLAEHPRIRAIAWLEKQRTEAEVDNQTVDWRATHTSALASAFLDDVRSSGLTTGAVTRVLDQEAGNEATAQYRDNGPDIGDHMGWIIGCAVLALGLFAFSGIAGRFIRSWRYPNEHDPRDKRLDFLRGWVIVAVVVTHIELSGPYSYITLNAIGGITGAEMFVLLSGVVLG
ncbi:MAG: OpgC domain-containing protein, partial [Aeromicrobium sp.]